MWWNNGMDWGGMGGGGWVIMTVLMLAFWALVVGGLVVLFRNRRPAGPDSGTTNRSTTHAAPSWTRRSDADRN